MGAVLDDAEAEGSGGGFVDPGDDGGVPGPGDGFEFVFEHADEFGIEEVGPAVVEVGEFADSVAAFEGCADELMGGVGVDAGFGGDEFVLKALEEGGDLGEVVALEADLAGVDAGLGPEGGGREEYDEHGRIIPV